MRETDVYGRITLQLILETWGVDVGMCQLVKINVQ